MYQPSFLDANDNMRLRSECQYFFNTANRMARVVRGRVQRIDQAVGLSKKLRALIKDDKPVLELFAILRSIRECPALRTLFSV